MYDPTETYCVGKFAEVHTGVTYSSHQCGKGKTGKSEGEVVQQALTLPGIETRAPRQTSECCRTVGAAGYYSGVNTRVEG
jgi:hypothetical protein